MCFARWEWKCCDVGDHRHSQRVVTYILFEDQQRFAIVALQRDDHTCTVQEMEDDAMIVGKITS